MAIYTSLTENELEHFDCFLCGESIEVELIYWLGMTGSVSFHPSCAQSFLLKLGRDVWEWERNHTGYAQVADP